MTAGAAGAMVWLDGALMPLEQARVSVDDLGFLYGAACFETMRAAGGVAFRLERHLERFERGLRMLRVPPPPRARLRAAIDATLAANGLRDARVRLTVSAGRGDGRPDLTAALAPVVLVSAVPLPPAPGPARLAVASLRIDARRPLREAKTANYLPSLLALAEAREAGCDDALLLTHEGHVAEAATANLFAVIGGALVTPPLDDGPLPGVTREVVLACARSLGLAVEERSLTLEAIGAAHELLLTSSVSGVRAVRAVVGRWQAAVTPGPVTAALAAAYEALVRAECGERGPAAR
ncbi:MAG: hypothetical protein EXR65_04790 [Dehalococcoidia bacterium]|nr:hypothetical protein [Dehalococcoidia bacterium]